MRLGRDTNLSQATVKQMPKVIRTGQKKTESAGITAEQVDCLQNFWELEEQLGIRAKPQDDLLKHIPVIRRNPNAERLGVDDE